MPNNQTATLQSRVGWAMPTQIAWAVLAALWNLYGVLLIANGQRAIGPTATITGAIMLSVFAAFYPITIRRSGRPSSGVMPVRC